MVAIHRRELLGRGAVLAGGLAVVGAFDNLLARAAGGAGARGLAAPDNGGGYGPLKNDPVLALPGSPTSRSGGPTPR